VLAIDPKSGLAGAAGFALVLFIGNLVNSFAEEDLFRGVLIPLFLREAAPWAAPLIAAFLFGVWHIPWALKVALSDSGAAAEPLAWRVLANFLPEALVRVGVIFARAPVISGVHGRRTC
jgi:membrane protease YdiL (CAAX protease family)